MSCLGLEIKVSTTSLPTAAESELRRQPKLVYATAEKCVERRRESAALEKQRGRTFCVSLVFSTHL